MKIFEPLKIGYPTNTRMREDCAPVSELLELEKDTSGILRSRFLPDAEFRPRRVNDIARLVKRGIFELGIIGDDTACEEGLEIPGWSSEILKQLENIQARKKLNPFDATLEPYLFYPENRVTRLRLGNPTFMTLFARQDMKNAFACPAELFQAGKIATSYPNLAKKSLRFSNFLKSVETESCDGSVEAIVANRDDPRVVGGFDVARTGKTMDAFELVSYGSVMESRPGIWKSFSTSLQRKDLVEDTVSALIERLSVIFL